MGGVSTSSSMLLMIHVHRLLTGHGLSLHWTRNLLRFSAPFRIPCLLLGTGVLRRWSSAILRSSWVARASGCRAARTNPRGLTQDRRLSCGKPRISVVSASIVIDLHHQPNLNYQKEARLSKTPARYNSSKQEQSFDYHFYNT